MAKPSLPKGVEKLPSGVEIHGKGIRIWFMFRGKRVYEPLPQITKINKNGLAYAKNKRDAITTEIREGRFDYLAHFPDSARALELTKNPKEERTVAEGVAIWLKVSSGKNARITHVNYVSKSKHVLERWPVEKIKDITGSDIELFKNDLLKSGLSVKTVNDVFTVVRGVWETAFFDEVIKSNPLKRIKNAVTPDDSDFADPFNRNEIQRLQSIDVAPQDLNPFLFAIWTGLSVSEWCGLAWEDVDTKEWTVQVRRAFVDRHMKVPKEKIRNRKIELIEPAIQILRKQAQYTKMLGLVEYDVAQRDNVTSKKESITLVFVNSRAGVNAPWCAKTANTFFRGLLKRAGLRHRGPNQCRHTFASQCLSAYVPMEMLAYILGHNGTTMIRKHYGRFIPSDMPSMAGWISKQLGFPADTNGLENDKYAPILRQPKQKNP